MATPKRAPRSQVPDSLDAIEECYRRGWTDGLPVVPPTADRVAAMLDYVGLAAEHVLGEVPVRRRLLTAEQAAANAVIAGCLPAYFPIVLSTMEVLFQHDPNCIHEVASVTNSTGLLMLVNGPIRQLLGLNCTDNLLSPANRANVTIGRAIRLILMNVFEQRPGVLDRGCMGSLTKYGVCFGEAEERSPWAPFHVSRGFASEDSTVTVATIQDPEMLGNRYGQTAESIMEATADAMASHGLAVHFHETQWLWIVGPDPCAPPGGTIRCRRRVLYPEALGFTAAASGGRCRLASARRHGDYWHRRLRRLFVGQFARRRDVGTARVSRGDDYHQCVRDNSPGLHPTPGGTDFSVPSLSAPDYQRGWCRPRGPGPASSPAGDPSVAAGATSQQSGTDPVATTPHACA
ncbi:hypothetical protein NKDENANG_02400 [Candidatus Entotheonellaceae bacterium PAL068K]